MSEFNIQSAYVQVLEGQRNQALTAQAQAEAKLGFALSLVEDAKNEIVRLNAELEEAKKINTPAKRTKRTRKD